MNYEEWMLSIAATQVQKALASVRSFHTIASFGFTIFPYIASQHWFKFYGKPKNQDIPNQGTTRLGIGYYQIR